MRISTKGRYGLTIMIELAKHYGEGPLPLRKIAEEKIFPRHTWSNWCLLCASPVW